ncbi:MAG: hypothetical protein Q7R51_01375 [bacterium]|nr:hypothetical protein [bacterium]
MFFKRNFFAFAVLVLLTILMLFNLSKLNHPATEFDEGVYLATFQLANAGYPLYSETFFSQPPGFFTVINPLFTAFGETLQSGRLSILLWSFVGLLAIFWIGYEIGFLGFALITIICLYSIPLYTTEIITFHADSVPAVFSLLAFALSLRYLKTKSVIWLIAMTFCIAAPAMIKLDITIIPSVTLLFILARKKLIKNLLFSFFAFVFFVFIFTVPFGIENVVNTAVSLRLQIMSHESFNPLKLFILLSTQKTLLYVFISGILLFGISIFKKIGKLSIHCALLLWIATSFLMLLIYRPLFPHHLFLLIMPCVLLFGYELSLILKKIDILKQISTIIFFVFLIILCKETIHRFNQLQMIETNSELEAIRIIEKYTKTTDFVVSDDGILNGITRRLAPPPLSDISQVRVSSGNLSTDLFDRSLTAYKPKLIVVWNKRLTNINNFSGILKKHHYQLLFKNQNLQKIYLLKR